MFEKQFQYYAALIGHYDVTGHEKTLNINEIQGIFNKMMESGVYHDEFIDILYPTSAISEDFMGPLKVVLEKLAIEIPKNYQDAVYRILRYHLFHIVEGTSDPVEGMLAISADLDWYDDMDAPGEHYYIWDYQDKKKLSQVTQEIAYLVGFCWMYRAEWDDMRHVIHYKDYRGEEAIELLEKDIVKAAQVWVKQHK